ncbi:23 kDa integral membrane -like [Brachionus plicatilis]|uniref:Tetraspanin n=1 Tax=Brachionus plicatilis TaxID=10195 RepID=A0A3M7PPX7_BRAPC|nr:23 kDa integral membrane -like [Brachionus plicatilis]
MARTGFFGSIIRIFLAIINVVFLLLGLSVFIASAVLRWSGDSILNKITSDEGVKSILNVSAINSVSLVLLILGAFITVLSLIGLCGTCCTNRFFLVVYEITIIILFIFHGILLVVAAFKSGTIESEFRKALNKTIDDLNSDQTSESDKTEKCSSLKFFSELFECCGANGPSDFKNVTLINDCCFKDYTDGCADRTIKSFKENGVNLIVIPNSIVLGLEFFIILLVPFLIGRIARARRLYEEEERIKKSLS